MEENKTFEPKPKKEVFNIVIPEELRELRNKASDREMLLSLNELIVHRLLDGAKLSSHKHLKVWPGVIMENDEKIKLSVVYNEDIMTGDEAEDYIYNRDFGSEKVLIVNRGSIPSFK